MVMPTSSTKKAGISQVAAFSIPPETPRATMNRVAPMNSRCMVNSSGTLANMSVSRVAISSWLCPARAPRNGSPSAIAPAKSPTKTPA